MLSCVSWRGLQIHIMPQARGAGAGTLLVDCVVNGTSELRRMSNFLLFTRDAHTLYEKFGWKRPIPLGHLFMDLAPRGSL